MCPVIGHCELSSQLVQVVSHPAFCKGNTTVHLVYLSRHFVYWYIYCSMQWKEKARWRTVKGRTHGHEQRRIRKLEWTDLLAARQIPCNQGYITYLPSNNMTVTYYTLDYALVDTLRPIDLQLLTTVLLPSGRPRINVTSAVAKYLHGSVPIWIRVVRGTQCFVNRYRVVDAVLNHSDCI